MSALMQVEYVAWMKKPWRSREGMKHGIKEEELMEVWRNQKEQNDEKYD